MPVISSFRRVPGLRLTFLILMLFFKALIKFKSHLYFEEKDLVDKAEKVLLLISSITVRFDSLPYSLFDLFHRSLFVVTFLSL